MIASRSRLEFGDVLFSGIGTIGKVAVVDIPTHNWNCSESIFLLKPKKDIIYPRFLMYILRSDRSKEQYESQSIGTTLRGVRMNVLSSIKIPIPPMSEQERIVSMLDRFDRLVNDLQEGLPAEITARQQQYEYYRDMLFSFTPKEIV